MGGLLGFHCGYNMDCKLLLFNPAFIGKDKYMKGLNEIYDKNKQKGKIKIVLGKNDT